MCIRARYREARAYIYICTLPGVGEEPYGESGSSDSSMPGADPRRITEESRAPPCAWHTCPRFSCPHWPHRFLLFPISVIHRPRSMRR